MFRHPFSFEGRIGRTIYGIDIIIFVTTVFIFNFVVDRFTTGAIGWLMVIYVPPTWFLLAQGAKRCHDVGRSGWWQLIPFYLFFLLFQEGDKASNSFGDRPHPAGNRFPYESHSAGAGSSGYAGYGQIHHSVVEEYETA